LFIDSNVRLWMSPSLKQQPSTTLSKNFSVC
jgi:hypothetical protein